MTTLSQIALAALGAAESQLVYATPWPPVKVKRKDALASGIRMARAPDFRPRNVATAPALLDAPAWCAGDPPPLR